MHFRRFSPVQSKPLLIQLESLTGLQAEVTLVTEPIEVTEHPKVPPILQVRVLMLAGMCRGLDENMFLAGIGRISAQVETPLAL